MAMNTSIRRSTRASTRVTAVTSAYLDLEADASDPDDDTPISSLVRASQQAAQRALDAEFIYDENEEDGHDEAVESNACAEPAAEEAPTNGRRRSNRRSNATLVDYFGSDGTSTEDYSSKDEASSSHGSGEANGRTADAASDRANPLSARDVGRPRNRSRANVAMWKRVGESNKGEPEAEFEPVRFGGYYTRVGGDLEVDDFKKMCDWLKVEAYEFSAGYERGDIEEQLHGQVQGILLICKYDIERALCR